MEFDRDIRVGTADPSHAKWNGSRGREYGRLPGTNESAPARVDGDTESRVEFGVSEPADIVAGLAIEVFAGLRPSQNQTARIL